MKLNEILQRLATARLITLSGDKYELAHDTLAKFIAGKRSAEEQAVINWERLVRNKWRASIQSGTPDYLTTAQLAGLLPYQAKLDLNAEERQFLLDSQEDSKKKVMAAKRWEQTKVGMALMFFVLISIALMFALSNKAAVERELERNQRILAGMYFYSDNFAMCVQKDSTGHLKYGFMDKGGTIRIPQMYDEANPFDDYGFARVKIKEKLFLIDTNNVQYSLAETTLALNENTRALRLSEKNLKEIPIEVYNYKELQILYLRGNDLTTIAPQIQGLPNLKIMDLCENNLLELPKELGELKSLKVLDIRKNQLTNIDAITPLEQLEFLNLSHNNLEAIPSEIQKWQALKLLNLSNNNLKTIPDEMVGLNQLKGLNLYNNPNLEFIPAGLFRSSLVLVLNEGQGAMLRKGGKSRYKKDTTSNEVVETNTSTSSVPEKTTETEITEAERKVKEESDKKAILQQAEDKKTAELAEAERKAKEDAEQIISANIDIEMVFVEGGTFTMGCTNEQGTDCRSNESPKHRVTLSSYSIGKYEVTQTQWKAVMGSNPSKFSSCDNCPVEMVNWYDVQEFIKKLNNQTGKTYRLPTEAEWEYAARGGNESRGYKYSGGDTWGFGSLVWYDNNSSKKTHPVGKKNANELGIYDMSGNVWEWCSDWFVGYSSSDQTNPKGASAGTSRVLRGGSWYNFLYSCRSSYRDFNNPDYRISYIGFRLAL